jgi:hypothetical protein
LKITLESTTKIVELATGRVPVHVRIWEGHTESGIPVHAYIARVAAPQDADQSQFQRELQECRAPSAAVAAIPLRLIL